MRILLLANNVAGLISFRFEVVKAIIEQGHFTTISAPFDKRMHYCPKKLPHRFS